MPPDIPEVLPSEVLVEIGSQYVSAVKAAVQQYENYRGDEDSVTGALGGTFDHIVRGQFIIENRRYTWSTKTKKMRGRGHKAPEKLYGADGIMEIEVNDAMGNSLARKLVPFQSKKEGRTDRESLANQARRLAQFPGDGLIVVYGPRKYVAMRASTVAEYRGVLHGIPQEEVHTLGDVLAGDFLTCRIGSSSLYYDTSTERILAVIDELTIHPVHFRVQSRTRTTINVKGR